MSPRTGRPKTENPKNERLHVRVTKEEKEILIELICDKQNRMIIKDYRKYESKKYKNLEKLKVKIKDI